MTRLSCVFVVGPESSGSTYIAKAISNAFGNAPWNGRGFNSCDDPQCDAANGYVRPCGACAQPKHMVCHRSMPFRDKWPPIDAWRQEYDARFVMCTRDQNVSRLSQKNRFTWKTEADLEAEHEQMLSMAKALLDDPDASVFVWSLETGVLFGDSMTRRLARFVGVPEDTLIDQLKMKDVNAPYVQPPRTGLMDRLRGRRG